MARQRNKGSNADVDINLTPMIDVVFNLIIFFMVITDMTQQDLAYLILPKSEMAVEDTGEEKERIIVNIIDMETVASKAQIKDGSLSLDRPPIMMDGRQVKSLDDMRAILYQKANPRRYPDTDKAQIAPGLHPSRKPVLVRCDQGQVFGWVQAIMQFCSFVPGRPQEVELQKSPLIYKLEIAAADDDEK